MGYFPFKYGIHYKNDYKNMSGYHVTIFKYLVANASISFRKSESESKP